MKQALRFLSRYLRPMAGLMALSALLALVSVGCSLYIPVLFGRAIDAIVAPGQVDFSAIGTVAWQVGLLILAYVLSTYALSLVNNRLTFRIVRQMREEMMHQLMRLPLSYLDGQPRGALLSRAINDVDKVADGLLMGFTHLFVGITTILATIVFMFLVHWLVALLVVVVTPLSLFVARFIAKKIHSHFDRQAVLVASSTAWVDEYLGNQKTVQAFAHEQTSAEGFDRIANEWEKVSTKAVFFSSLTNPCTRCVNAIVYALVVCVGCLSCAGLLPVGDMLTVGGLSVILSYATQYTKPFNEISGVITELQNACVCAVRIQDLLSVPVEEEATDLPIDTQESPSVSVQNVDFSYVPDRPLIEDLSVEVPSGAHVAIVGPTGCGKTTLINLLMRFYDVKAGSIRVNGQDIRDIPRRAHRARFGMVLQDTWLRHATVRDNIAIGKPDATLEEIRQAAVSAHADGFIRRLPQGYDTVIDDGSGLSVGQKQLLCIARAMLNMPPMLILDEATSSIDTRTELKIRAAFDRLTRGKTSFIVAHRLSTIRSCDIILVMRDGQVIEQGSHEELMAQDGFYRHLYQSGIQ